MIVERRVFQAKVGQASAVVAKIREFQTLVGASSWPPGRIYTDLYSGHTDRVAWEVDIESLGQMESLLKASLQKAASQKAFAKWFEGLTPLIEGATVELWTRQETPAAGAPAQGRRPSARTPRR